MRCLYRVLRFFVLLLVTLVFSAGVLGAQPYIARADESSVTVEAASEEELRTQLANAKGTQYIIKLTSNVVLGSELVVDATPAQDLVLDLNGRTLSRSMEAAAADGHVVTVHKGAKLTIRDTSRSAKGLITGGWATDGGGIYNEGDLTILGTTVRYNKATHYGAGIANLGSLTAQGLYVENNEGAINGGGVWNEGTLTMTDCYVRRHTVTGSMADFPSGGGIYAHGTMTLLRCTVHDNAAEVGGGVYSTCDNANITDCMIRGNTATRWGGGLYVNTAKYASPSVVSTRTTVRNNKCEHEGGGIYTLGTVTLNDITVTSNQANNAGGGILNDDLVNLAGKVIVNNNTVGGKPSNIDLRNHSHLAIMGAIQSGSKMGLTSLALCYVATSGYATYNTESPSTFFFSDDAEKIMYEHESGEAYLVKPIVYFEEYGEEQTCYLYTDVCRTYRSPSHVLQQFKPGVNVVEGSFAVKPDYAGQEGFEVPADVTLVLCDGCTFDAGRILVSGGALSICGQQENSGTLVCELSLDGCAGIGGGVGTSAMYPITINGGTVRAWGGKRAAGIGGGLNGPCSPITINGGVVEADGGFGGPGIGGGPNDASGMILGSNGTITINGGTVRAKGRGRGGNELEGGGGAGIGCGACLNPNATRTACDDIVINGGVVEARGDAYGGAGIGGGGRADQLGTITINGGRVKADGYANGVGIGGGAGGKGGVIVINGGTTEAITGFWGTCAVGNYFDDGDHGMLVVADNIVVSQGDSSESATQVEGAERNMAGWYTKYARFMDTSHLYEGLGEGNWASPDFYSVPVHDHVPGEIVRQNEVAPTCTEDGGHDEETHCASCDEVIELVHYVDPALGHDWDEPTYEWSDDGKRVTATRVCARDATHVETETVDAQVSDTASNATTKRVTYVATFVNPAFEAQTRSVEVSGTSSSSDSKTNTNASAANNSTSTRAATSTTGSTASSTGSATQTTGSSSNTTRTTTPSTSDSSFNAAVPFIGALVVLGIAMLYSRWERAR